MHEQPSLSELAEAVRRFIAETARPQLTGHAAFHARVAENVLAIIERELEQSEDADRAARKRLAALLGESRADSPRHILDRRLSEAIRQGEMTLDTPGLLEHLKASTIDQLKVDQPRYSGLAIATKSGQD